MLIIANINEPKKEDSKESSNVSIFGVAQSILDILETAQDLGLEVIYIIANQH